MTNLRGHVNYGRACSRVPCRRCERLGVERFSVLRTLGFRERRIARTRSLPGVVWPPHQGGRNPSRACGVPSISIGSPSKIVQCPGKRPILRFFYQPMADRILVNVRPLRVVAITRSKLCVPEIDLPSERRIRLPPSNGGQSFPVTDPGSQRRMHYFGRSTE